MEILIKHFLIFMSDEDDEKLKTMLNRSYQNLLKYLNDYIRQKILVIHYELHKSINTPKVLN